MSIYKTGLTVVPATHFHRRGTVVGLAVATPGAIRDEANQMNSEVHTMDLELGRTRSSWPAKLNATQAIQDAWWSANWVPFFSEWSKYWEDHGNTWGLVNWYHNFWGSSWETIQDFRKRLVSLRESAKLVGYGFTGPEPTPPKEGPLDGATSELWRMVKFLIYAAVVVVGGVVVLRLVGVV